MSSLCFLISLSLLWLHLSSLYRILSLWYSSDGFIPYSISWYAVFLSIASIMVWCSSSFYSMAYYHTYSMAYVRSGRLVRASAGYIPYTEVDVFLCCMFLGGVDLIRSACRAEGYDRLGNLGHSCLSKLLPLSIWRTCRRQRNKPLGESDWCSFPVGFRQPFGLVVWVPESC